MGKWSKIALSGSTNGEGIPITATTAAARTAIHTAVTGDADSIDEIILYAYNTATTVSELTLFLGATTATGSHYTHTLPAGNLGGLQPVSPGLVLNNALVVGGTVTAAGRVNIFGWVNRYTT